MRSFELDDCEVRRETDKALLVYIEDLDEEAWVPRSVIHDDSEVFDADENSEGVLAVKMWFAEKQGWV